MKLADAKTWLAELDEAIADGDLSPYRASCQVLAATLRDDHPPEVVRLFEEYMRCRS